MLGGYSVFGGFEPVAWMPNVDKRHNTHKTVYSTRKDHGIAGRYTLHNLNDAINEDLPDLEKVLIGYSTGKITRPLVTVHDILDTPYEFNECSSGNIRGMLAERVARRVTRRFLQRQDGRTGGIFASDFNPEKRESYIVANTENLILRIKNYPNMIILRKTGEGHYGYQEIKEIDGLFDYRQGRRRHIVVLESKVEGININRDLLVNNLFAPLRELFPETGLSYILFAQKNQLYNKTDMKIRRLKQTPVALYEQLKANGVSTLFFSFNEDENDFQRMATHLLDQKKIMDRKPVAFQGRIRLSQNSLLVFNGGENPLFKLARDPADPRRWVEEEL